MAADAGEAGNGEAASRTRERLLLDHPNAVDILNDQAWFLATDEAFENGERALELAKRAVALKEDAAYFDTLAMAHVAVDDLEAAITAQRRAAELDPDTPRFRERVEMFEASRQSP